MATKKKKKTTKKSNNVQNVSELRNKKENSKNKKDTEKKSFFEGKSQLVAVILFVIGIFSLFVTFIEGEKLWNLLHNFSFGMLGYCAFMFPLVLLYASIIIAMERAKNIPKSSIVFTSLIVLFLAAGFFIFGNDKEFFENENFLTYITQSYEVGISSVNGGVIGAFVGGLLVLIFGQTGAAITDALLIFLWFMLLTRTPLMYLFSTIFKPVQKVKKAAEKSKERREEERRREREEAEQETDFGDEDYFGINDEPTFVDIPIGPSPKDDKNKRKVETVDIPFVVGEAEEPEEEDTLRILELEDDYVPEEETPKPEKKAPRGRKKKEETTVKAEDFEVPEFPITDETEAIYKKPPYSCLKNYETGDDGASSENLEMTARKLVEVLRSYKVETSIVAISKGPSVTRYELKPAPGVVISKITKLSNEIAMNLAASSAVRVEAPIPGKAAVGIEVPNSIKAMVSMREIVESPEYQKSKSKLNVAIGKDIAGNIICADIAKMPHLLIAGTTGSGKSVCLNAMIISLLYNATPDEVKLLMIDPKKVEFNTYNGIPHLLVPVVDDPRKAAGALAWAVTEMNNRYKLFSQMNVRDIYDYNKRAQDDPDMPKMHQIVIFIDELSDLMMAASREVEDSICRLAQMARAAGMHLVIATQRPSVDVITGLIKANVPSRIALMVSSNVDSRTIIDTAGAEKLLGNGDMLFAPVGKSKPTRIQGCFI
ncbi:MAG: DNA translocase FtsK [Clostridia bacterium]|nr:DNA translocase FtsK [Clostridia bacterium]